MKSIHEVQHLTSTVLDGLIDGTIDPVKAAALNSTLKRYEATVNQMIAIARHRSSLEAVGVDWKAILGTKQTT